MSSTDQPRRDEQCEDPCDGQSPSGILSLVLVLLGIAGVGLLSLAGYIVGRWFGFALVLGLGCLMLVPFIRLYVFDWS